MQETLYDEIDRLARALAKSYARDATIAMLDGREEDARRDGRTAARHAIRVTTLIDRGLLK